MSSSRELKILKSTEKQLQKPNARSNLNILVISLFLSGLVFVFVTFVLRKQGILTEGVSFSLAGGAGALLGISLYLKYLGTRS